MGLRLPGIAAVIATIACLLAVPDAALAHGLQVRQDLPIPDWLFGWAAAVVLLVSFVALAVLWPRPRLQQEGWRPLPEGLSSVLASRALELACGVIGVGLLLLVVYSGLRGTEIATENFATTFVYVIFWIGFPLASALIGDVFRAFNPWRAVGRAVSWVGNRAAGVPLPAPLSYPDWLGRWPAAAGIFAFVWLEVAAPAGDTPHGVAVATLVYSGVTFLGMALFGVEAWTSRAEAFSVYFNLVSRISIFEGRGGRLGIRRPLSGLAALDPLPGTVALVAVLIGTVSFDGFSAGQVWNQYLLHDLQSAFKSIGFDVGTSLQLIFGLGIAVMCLLVYGFYRLGIAGAHSVGGDLGSRQLARTFAHSLVPIALVYALAHYISLLLLQGQAIVPLASDPLGRGSDLFGTASSTPNLAAIGAETFWYIQVGLVIAGHVSGLILAHDRAVAIYDKPRLATRSQYWMLAVMVGFTSYALWLLSEASKG